MRFSLNPRYWFQKRSSDFAIGKAEISNRMRYNSLYMLDPDVLVRHLGAFAAGDIAGLEHVIEDFENRDDKMKIGAFKMAAAVASKPWEVRIAKGEEDNERARLHKEVLTRFWNRIEVTDAFCRNRKGGVRLLVKQMMSAESRVYAVHDLVWNVRGDGELTATFTQIPAWCFENRTGELRYLREPGAYTGEPMRAGEWLVTVGEGVGVTAAILAMSKRLSWNDWLLFSEKCGMPLILGNTGAKENSPAWNALLSAIAAIAPKTGILTDLNSKMQAVQIGGSSGQATYKDLVETVDRAISALYRGGDLATMSSTQGEGTGSDAQDGESELMDGDGCAMVSETLHNQIDRFVIRFTCGDFEPLAGIVINPPAETTDIDREIKIDNHLAALGVKLSKADALQRYGRTEAESDDDALQPPPNGPQNGLPGGFGGLPNERAPATPLQTALQPCAKREEGSGRTTTPESGDAPQRAILAAFAKDTSKAAEAVKALLAEEDPSKLKALSSKLLADLPSLIPDDPALAAVIAEAMAKEFGTVELANAITNPCPKCHRQMTKEGICTHCANLAANQKTVDGLVADLDIKGPDGKSKGWKDRTESLGELEQKTIDDIKAANPKMNVDSSVATVNTEQLQHSLNHHGNAKREAKRGQIAITKDDLKRIPEVLADYDSILPGKGIADGKNQESVVFRKKYPDGTVACVELDVFNDSMKKRTLKFQTMWKEKN